MARFATIAALVCAALLAPTRAGAGGAFLARTAATAVDPTLAALDAEPACFPDPIEGFNRAVFAFNDGVDRGILDPVTRAYRFVVPNPIRLAVGRALENLGAPAVLANDVLQLEFRRAGNTAARFLLNTTVGAVGLIDVAAKVGVPGHSADFGQTLALVGMPSGPYLMLPLLGPTTARDGFGRVVDLLFRPTTYLLGPADQLIYTTLHGSSVGIARRDAMGDGLQALRESSIDFYAAVRSAYYQTRMAEIRGESPSPGT